MKFESAKIASIAMAVLAALVGLEDARGQTIREYRYEDALTLRCVLCAGASISEESPTPCTDPEDSLLRVFLQRHKGGPWLPPNEYNRRIADSPASRISEEEAQDFCLDAFISESTGQPRKTSSEASSLSQNDGALMLSSGLRPTTIPNPLIGAVALPGGHLALYMDDNGAGSVKFIAIPLHSSGIKQEKDGYPSFRNYFLIQSKNGQYQYAKAFAASVGDSWKVGASHLAATLDPRFGILPTRVHKITDCSPKGTNSLSDQPIFSPTGEFECYRLVMVLALAQQVGGRVKLFHTTTAVVTKAFGRGTERIREPARPEVVKAELTSPIRALLDTDGREVLGFEPTMTADSRLLVAQVLEGKGGPGHAFLFSATPWLHTDWSAPVEIARMHHYRTRRFCMQPGTPDDSCPGRYRTTLAEQYPIFKEPFKDFEGRPIPEKDFHIFGYPWLDFDGRNIFFQAVRRSAFSVAGVDTRHRIFQIDGPPNLIRNYQRPGASPMPCLPEQGNLCKGLTRTFSPGSSSGFWGVYPDAPGLIFPLSRRSPLHFMFHPTPSLQGRGVASYAEVSLHDSVDPDYLVSLRMNEPVVVRPHYKYNKIFSGFDLLTDRVADASGNSNTAYLRQGAAFPEEYIGADTVPTSNPGFLGRAVFFPAGSSALIKNNATLAKSRSRVTVEIAVKPLRRTRDEVAVVVKEGAWELLLGADGVPRVALVIDGDEYTSGPIGTALKVGEWSHLLFTYRSKGQRRFGFFVNGIEVLEENGERLQFAQRGGDRRSRRSAGDSDSQGLPEGPISGSNSDIILGPASTGGNGDSGRNALYLLDEFALSKVARVRGYASIAAFSENSLQYIDVGAARKFPIKPPLGLFKEDLLLPRPVADLIDKKLFSQVVKLGEELFAEEALSLDASGESQGVSCATCHRPNSAFADNRRFSKGAGDDRGSRNVPTLVNRAFSVAQMLDSRTPHLVTQVLLPLGNKDEMNADLGRVADFLLDPENRYFDRFSKLFNVTRSGKASQDEQRERVLRALAVALASFESTIFAGNSTVDRIRAGLIAEPESAVLRGMEVFNGKARCIACHSGPNYTDELAHVTGTALKGERGRARVTGLEIDEGAFKTPTLRQLSATGPYFHNGSAETLDDVIDFYDRGGAKVDNLDSEMRRLHLSEQEKRDLVTFLRALTGEVTSGMNQ